MQKFKRSSRASILRTRVTKHFSFIFSKANHDDLFSHHHHAHQDTAEFSYYQNCFSWTLRNGNWKKIPNNTLAEGDIIKLLPDDKAPALIGVIN